MSKLYKNCPECQGFNGKHSAECSRDIPWSVDDHPSKSPLLEAYALEHEMPLTDFKIEDRDDADFYGFPVPKD